MFEEIYNIILGGDVRCIAYLIGATKEFVKLPRSRHLYFQAECGFNRPPYPIDKECHIPDKREMIQLYQMME